MRDALGQAAGHLEAGRHEAAERICRTLLAQVPGQPDVLHLMGLAQVGRDDAEGAVRTLEAAAAAAPGDAGVLASLGQAQLGRERHAEAAHALRRAVQLAPDMAHAHHLLGLALEAGGDRDGAAASLRAALRLAPDHMASHKALSRVLLPGDDYKVWLERLHRWLQPAGYVEIGIETGKVLRLAAPPTRAVGIDPAPVIEGPLPDTIRVFPVESDAFFRDHHLPDAIGLPAVDLAFIDGLHVFEQALRDFIHVERFCAPNAVVLLHDCLPIDGPSSEPVRRTGFWTGDPWKVTAALRRFRPDLTAFTVACPPSGLAVVTRLDPEATLLSERYDAVVAALKDMTYDDLQREGPEAVLGIVPNDWEAVRARLAAAGAGPA